MKLRVMSKLGLNEPKPFYLESTRQQHQNHSFSALSPLGGSPRSEYFPQAGALLPKDRLQAGKKQRNVEFFNNFQTKCKVSYERVEPNYSQVNRKLTPLLQAMKKAQSSVTPIKDQYQFSFKKQETPATLQAFDYQLPIPHQQRKGFTYYLHNANRPKIKLRKFNSLISVKNSTQSVITDPVLQPIRRNLSMAKKQGSILRIRGKSRERNCTENEEEKELKVKQQMRDSVKTEVFEQEKERLTRIRRELNQIYQANKQPSEIRLKIYQAK